VRHCRTALPHKRTVLSPESFVVTRGRGTWCRDRKQRPPVRPTSSRRRPGALQNMPGARPRSGAPARGFSRECPGGISSFRGSARRGVASIQCAGRSVSHKLATYYEASIPSCSRAVDRRVPVVRRPPAGVWSAYLLPIYRYLHRHLLRFTAVYAHLFETMSLNSLVLPEFAPFFCGCGSAAAALPHGIDKAQGGRDTREWMR